MQRIHYSGASFLTGDEVAHAVIAYAHALAVTGGAAEVVLPVRLNDGGVGTATLLIGPASQFFTIDEQSPFAELTADDLVKEWNSEVELLGREERTHSGTTPVNGR